MTRNALKNEYFDWMCSLVEKPRSSRNYDILLNHLHGVDFDYILPLDGDRAEHGIELRYRFGRERGYHDAMIASYLDDRPCSILEMMVALAVRCEERIMWDPDIGDRTNLWFWDMIKSLGLTSMDDENYDMEYVEDVIFKFLNRTYKPNGKGGLFTVKNAGCDLRNVEIWYQMCRYLNNIT